MLRLLFRFVGLLFLAAAFASLVVDGARSVANGAIAILPLDRTASALFPSSFEKFHALVLKIAPKVWEPVVVPMLQLPAWLFLGVIGVLLLAITRRPAPKIGYSRR